MSTRGISLWDGAGPSLLEGRHGKRRYDVGGVVAYGEHTLLCVKTALRTLHELETDKKRKRQDTGLIGLFWNGANDQIRF